MTATRSGRSANAGRLDPDELAALEEQRDFLLRSLDDLEREHAAGDLDDTDYETLRDDYTSRAAEVIRAIDHRLQAFEDAKRPRSAGRTVAIVAAVAIFAVVAGVVASSALGSRKAGQSASGGGGAVTLGPSQRARQCLTAEVQTSLKAATKAQQCFNDVLEDDPTNATALAYKGWVSYLTAIGDNVLPDAVKAQSYRSAVQYEERAIKADPKLPDARAFRVVLAVAGGEYQKAQQYLDDLKAMDPPQMILDLLQQQGVEQAIRDGLAGKGPAASTTTTTTPG